MSAVRNALDAHNIAAADRQRQEREMASAWRDAASHVVEVRFLDPLSLQDREFAAALAELDQQLARAINLIR